MKPLELFVPFVVVSAITLLPADSPAQELGGSAGVKENLDLPASDGVDLEAVLFYGQELEAAAFFWVVDRSASMQNSGELDRAKQEVCRNISRLSSDTEFAVVYFDVGILRFPPSDFPAEANAGTRSEALSWVEGVPGGAGSCMAEGLRQALQYANLATARNRVIMYIGDGGGTCMGSNEHQYLDAMLATISEQNYRRVPIHCVGILREGSRALHEEYMKKLASANGGTYRRLDPPGRRSSQPRGERQD